MQGGIGNLNGLWGGEQKRTKEAAGSQLPNQRFQNEGISTCEKGLTGLCAKDVAKACNILWRLR